MGRNLLKYRTYTDRCTVGTLSAWEVASFHPDPEPAMIRLMKSALIILTASLVASGSCAGAAGSETPLAAAMKQFGHDAVATIERDIHARMLETSRMLLEEALPAELAATPAQATVRPIAVTARAQDENRTPIVAMTRGGSSTDSGERATLRWQSLLPGMMK
ncbi:MAG TPA: hypothetical protein PKZ76_06160 [Xanthomonadaceae bacterium]|nr:hypothetical protein [Xanthomonadaceae bacterium]